MPKCDFNKVAKQFFETTFLQNTSRRLLLTIKSNQVTVLVSYMNHVYPKMRNRQLLRFWRKIIKSLTHFSPMFHFYTS